MEFKGTKLLDTLGRRNRILEDKKCENCGKVFRPVDSKKRTCSRECGYKIRKVNSKNKDKGNGWVNAKGYREIRVNGRIVKEHRNIMEQFLGKKLSTNEHVHHKNGVKTDNRIENLEVITSSEHSILHNKERVYTQGYKLNLSDIERQRRSAHMRYIRLSRN